MSETNTNPEARDVRQIIANWLVDVDGIADEELAADHLIAALAAEGMVIVPKYIFDTDGRCDGRPRIIDLCYTAFDRAKDKNDEDGGPTDWFNDTKPQLDKAIAALPTPPHASASRR